MIGRQTRVAVDIVHDGTQAEVVLMILRERDPLPTACEGLVLVMDGAEPAPVDIDGVKEVLIQLIEHL